MTARPDTWMAFYVGDYVTNTLHLTTRQHGGYLLLILAAWKGGGVLPGTDTALAAIARLAPKEWREDGPTLKAFLTRRDDEWIHERVMFEWNEARVRSDSKSKAGREGAQKRWGGRTDGRPMADPPRTASSKPMADPLAYAKQIDAPLPSQLQEQEQILKVGETGLVETSAPAVAVADDLEISSFLKRDERGSRLPEGWQPNEKLCAFAVELGLDPPTIAAEFTDYWRGVPGQKGRKTDWDGTFRNRCREKAERRAPRRDSQREIEGNAAIERGNAEYERLQKMIEGAA